MLCLRLRVVAASPSLVVDHALDTALAAVILPVCITAALVVAGLDVLDGRGVGLSMRCGRGTKSQDGGESVNELHIEGKCWV